MDLLPSTGKEYLKQPQKQKHFSSLHDLKPLVQCSRYTKITGNEIYSAQSEQRKVVRLWDSDIWFLRAAITLEINSTDWKFNNKIIHMNSNVYFTALSATMMDVTAVFVSPVHIYNHVFSIIW